MHLYAITGGSMSIDSKDIEAIAKYWDERSQYFDEEHNTEDLSLWSLKKIMEMLKKYSTQAQVQGFLHFYLQETDMM